RARPPGKRKPQPGDQEEQGAATAGEDRAADQQRHAQQRDDRAEQGDEGVRAHAREEQVAIHGEVRRRPDPGRPPPWTGTGQRGAKGLTSRVNSGKPTSARVLPSATSNSRSGWRWHADAAQSGGSRR